MRDKSTLTPTWKKVMGNKKIFTIILPISAVLVTLLIASYWISQPTRPAKKPRQFTQKLVEVIPVKYIEASPVLQVGGEVMASKSVVITPQVSGRIVQILGDLAPGTVVHKGDILVQIDEADYVLEEQKAKAELSQAMASYEQELGEQAVAHRELEILTEQNMASELSEQQRKLILRHPQLVQVKAEVDAAKATLAKAILDLERTKIRAPFTGIVSEKYVDLGLQISTTSSVVELVDSEEYWIKVALPTSYIQQLHFAGDTKGSNVDVLVTGNYSTQDSSVDSNEDSNVESEALNVRQGEVYKRFPQLDSSTRQAQVLVRVLDPLALHDENKGKPQLLVNDFVSLKVFGKQLDSVFVVDESVVRNGNQVWIYDNGRLRIETLDVIWREAGRVFLGAGLNDNDLLITTDIANATDGLRVVTIADKQKMQKTQPEVGNHQESMGKDLKGERPRGERPGGERQQRESSSDQYPASRSTPKKAGLNIKGNTQDNSVHVVYL